MHNEIKLEDGRKIFFINYTINENNDIENFNCAWTKCLGKFTPSNYMVEYKNFLVPLCDEHHRLYEELLSSGKQVILTEDGLRELKPKEKVRVQGIAKIAGGAVALLLGAVTPFISPGSFWIVFPLPIPFLGNLFLIIIGIGVIIWGILTLTRGDIANEVEEK